MKQRKNPMIAANTPFPIDKYLEKLADTFEKTLRKGTDLRTQGYLALRDRQDVLNDAEGTLKSIVEAEAAVLTTYADATWRNDQIIMNEEDNEKIVEAENAFRQALRAVDGTLGNHVIGTYFTVVQEAALNTLGVTIAKTEKNRAR